MTTAIAPRTGCRAHRSTHYASKDDADQAILDRKINAAVAGGRDADKGREAEHCRHCDAWMITTEMQRDHRAIPRARYRR